MGAYTVTLVEREKAWEGNYGPMKDFIVTLRDSEGHENPNVTVPQKAATAPVTVGQTLNGTIEPGQWGLKFKKDQQQQGGGGGGWRPRDPAETAAIQRQHSQHMALLYLGVQQSRGRIAEGFTLEGLKAIVDWFEVDIKSKPQVYGELKRKDTPQTGESDVPSDAPQHGPASDAGTPWKDAA